MSIANSRVFGVRIGFISGIVIMALLMVGFLTGCDLFLEDEHSISGEVMDVYDLAGLENGDENRGEIDLSRIKIKIEDKEETQTIDLEDESRWNASFVGEAEVSVIDEEEEYKFHPDTSYQVESPRDDLDFTAYIENDFAGGSGIEDDPYFIITPDHLKNVNEETEAHFMQLVDLNLEDEWEPLDEFAGTYDGNDKIIEGIKFSREAVYSGLFKEIEEEGKVKKLSLKTVDIKGQAFTGGIAGASSGTITGVNVEGEITATDVYSGGLVGINDDGIILSSNADVKISGERRTGGLVGENTGMIKDSRSKGYISGEDEIGGLVGLNDEGEIFNCISDVEVQGEENVGGLAGYNSGTIGPGDEGQSSTAQGTVTGEETVGGFVGENDGIIKESESNIEITGFKNVGGFAGINEGEIESSFAKGTLEAKGTEEREENLGGFVGRNKEEGKIYRSFADYFLPIASEYDHIGGLVGLNLGRIEQSFANGTLEVDEDIIARRLGGLTGRNKGEVINSYAAGDVKSPDGYALGGLVGDNDDGSIVSSYAVGLVEGEDAISKGGLVGDTTGEIERSYFDKETTEQTSDNGYARTTLQMKQGEPNDRLDEDGNEAEDGDLMYEDWEDEDVWYFEDDEYPTLLWE